MVHPGADSGLVPPRHPLRRQQGDIELGRQLQAGHLERGDVQERPESGHVRHGDAAQEQPRRLGLRRRRQLLW